MSAWKGIASLLLGASGILGCAAGTCSPDGGCDAGSQYPDAASAPDAGSAKGGDQYAQMSYDVSGLQNGKSLTLTNDGKDVVLSGNGSFVVRSFVIKNKTYAISVGRQPERQACEVRGALSGIADEGVIHVSVSCGARMSGFAKGLISGAAVDVSNGAETVHITQSGKFSYVHVWPSGTAFAQEITSVAGGQSCTVTPAFGVASGNVSDISIVCDDLWTLSSYLGGDAGHVDGERPEFDKPWAMVRSRSGDIYLSELSHDIRKISNGTVRTIAGSGNGMLGYQNGPGSSALFNNPTGIAFDEDTGIVYVADARNNVIRKLEPLIDGGYEVSTLTGRGAAGRTSAPLNNAQLYQPSGLALDRHGNLWLSEAPTIAQALRPGFRRISKGGWVTFETGPCGAPTEWKGCWLVFDTFDNLISSDPGQHIIRMKVDPNILDVPRPVLAGNGDLGYQDGKGQGARFAGNLGIVLNPDGYYYIADHLNNRIRSMSSDGTVRTIVGNGDDRYVSGEGVRASLSKPVSIVVESEDTMLVSSLGSNAIMRLTKKQ